jgi:hypothetical protein
LLSIASICVRLTGQFAAADFLGVAAIATITFGAQRDTSFQTAARAAAIPSRVAPPADSSVAVR